MHPVVNAPAEHAGQRKGSIGPAGMLVPYRFAYIHIRTMATRSIVSYAAFLLFALQAHAQAPDLIWGRNFGGLNVSGLAKVTRSCITPDGGVVNAGWFLNEADLDNDPNAEQLFDSNGSENGFVMRLDPAGLTEWAVRFSGIGQCRVLDVEQDDDGNLYAAVKFDGSLDVDPGAGSVLLYAAGMGGDMRDIVVVKLDAQGQYLASAQFSDVEFQMEGVILEINSAGQPVVAFISDQGVIHSHTLSGADLSTVSSFDFGNLGVGTGFLGDMQLDAQDNQLYAGRFSQEFNLDPQDPFADTPAFGTGDDLFFSKISPVGELIWGHVMGSNNGNDGAYSICTSPDGGVLVTGYVGGIMDVDPGPGNVSIISFGDPDIFLLKMSATDEFEWVKRITSTGEDRGWCVRTDAQGKIALTGFIGATCDVDPGPATTTITTSASSIITWEFNGVGDFLWAAYVALGDYVNSPVRVDHFADGALHVHGCVADLQLDRDPSAAVDLLYTSDGLGAMNLKWGTCAAVVPTIAITASANPVCPGNPVTFTAAITNGGNAPLYQWTVNGSPVGGNSDTYSVSALQLGDVVTCTLTSDADCADPNDAQSNEITVDCGQALGVLIFSEYVEGSANNKALEIFNPTANDVDLADYSVALYANGSATPTQSLQLTGILPSGQVYVIANSSASAAVLAVADITSAVCSFNGDDAIALLYQNLPTDIIGEIGIDPGGQWGIPTGGGTADNTLRRIPTVTAPESDWSIAEFQWNDFDQDDFTDLGDGITTGFTEHGNEKSLLLPNPTRDGFRINWAAPVHVRVIAPSGALVMEMGRVAPGAFISTDHLDSGVYIVVISDGAVQQHQRLAVE